MPSSTSDNINPQTGKPYRMCRKCTTAPPHRMKDCPKYNRPVKARKDAQQSTVPTSDTFSPASGRDIPDSANNLPSNDAFSPPPCSQGSASVQTVILPSQEQNLHSDFNNGHTPGPLSPGGNHPASTVQRDSSDIGFASSNSKAFDENVIDPVLRSGQSSTSASRYSPHPSTPGSFDKATIERSQSPDTPMRLLDEDMTTAASERIATPVSSPVSSRVLSPGSSPLSTPTKTKRAPRPTRSNPLFGQVVGAYRGTTLLPVVRTRKPTKSTPKEANIPKIFYDRTPTIISALDDLATRTGCWLYFSAQHPTSTQPFIHYTSQRLRTEGGGLLDAVHEANRQLYSSLKTARRRDTAPLAADLAKAQETLKQVQDEALVQIAAKEAEAKEAEARLAAANATTSKLIAEMAKHGIPVPKI
ncbi:hypothetical protein VNI00_001724 [Paramarasmius palmivorus]|uniref:Uncharacterized protein n=1 Tax=Paramarasmius palmivorus TaxID=297713 RepID=A0AAW0E7F5_9AGAR